MELTKKQFVISILPSVLIMAVSLLMLFGNIINPDHNFVSGGMAVSSMLSFTIGGIIPITLIKRRNIDISKCVLWEILFIAFALLLLILPFFVIKYFGSFGAYCIFAPISILAGFIFVFKKTAKDRQKCLLLILSNPLLHFLMFIILTWIIDMMI